MCSDSQTGLEYISEPLVDCCHGKGLIAAYKCIVPSQKCAAEYNAYLLWGKIIHGRKMRHYFKVDHHSNAVHVHCVTDDFGIMNNHIFYSTCDSVQSIKCMVKSDDIQERDSSIFKPFVSHCCILGHG